MSVPTIDPTDTLAVLKAAEEWLRDPQHWTANACWRGARGYAVGCRDAVTQTCIVGALSYVAGADEGVKWPQGPYEALAEALGVKCDVSAINDMPGGYARVMAGLRKAIETLEAKQS